jgi:hypothetical protein
MGGYLLPSSQVGTRVTHVLEVFPRLGEMLGRRAGKLSGGERKMLAMGRVLMLEPGVFLLDEPTANLAPAIAGTLLSDHVRRLAENGAAVLIVEQRARAVLAISDHTYVLGGGQLLMEGTPAELSASPEFVESFLGGGRPRVLPARPGSGVAVGGLGRHKPPPRGSRAPQAPRSPRIHHARGHLTLVRVTLLIMAGQLTIAPLLGDVARWSRQLPVGLDQVIGAAVGMGGPVLYGVVFGHLAQAMIAAIGALGASGIAVPVGVRRRAMHLVSVVGVVAAAGLVGASIAGRGWTMAAAVVATALLVRVAARGLGTTAGVLAGSALILWTLPSWLFVLVVAVLGGLRPFLRARNYALYSVVMTPLVVLLLDFGQTASAAAIGYRLADTVTGCAIAFAVGYLPWLRAPGLILARSGESAPR